MGWGTTRVGYRQEGRLLFSPPRVSKSCNSKLLLRSAPRIACRELPRFKKRNEPGILSLISWHRSIIIVPKRRSEQEITVLLVRHGLKNFPSSHTLDSPRYKYEVSPCKTFSRNGTRNGDFLRMHEFLISKFHISGYNDLVAGSTLNIDNISFNQIANKQSAFLTR